jgi:PPP family 3-phenylpropionic acid transporter
VQANSHNLRAFNTKSDSKAFLGLWASSFCYFAALGFIFPFLPLLLQMSELTYAQIGMIYMAGLAFSVLLQAPWGALADRIGRRMVVISTTLAAAIISGLYPYASSFVQFLLLGLVWYTFLAAATTVTPVLAIDMAGPVTVGKRFGIYRISGSLGWIMSTAVGGLICGTWGIKSIFYISAVLYLLSATFIGISVTEPSSRGKEVSTGTNWTVLTRDKNFLILLVTVFLINIPATTFLSFLSLYINEIGGSDTIVGWAFAIAAVTEVPCMVYLGAFSDRIGRKPLLVAALFSHPLRLFLYTVVSYPYLILPVQLLNGLTFGVLYVASVAFVSDITSESRGTALGLYNTASYAGSAAGSALGGVIADNYGLINMYRFMTAFSLIPALLFTFIAKESLSKR